MKKCDVLCLFASAVALAIVLAEPRANAQAEDQAAARSLFDEGRRLLKAGRYADACPKLEAASKLYSSAGILLNLADCYEKAGRSASAWTEFGEAASVAERARRPEQAKEAKRRQTALEAKLTRLTVRVSSEVPGLRIRRDETDLAQGMWGSPVPVDPGSHEIRAEAPGREPWTKSVDVSTPGETTTVEIPELHPVPAPAAPPPDRTAEPQPALTRKPPSESEPTPRSHVLDWALIGGGAAVAIAGAVVMGIEAGRTANARAETYYPKAINDYNSATTPYYVGLGGLIAGSASAAAGLLILTMVHESPQTTGLRAVPWVGLSACGVGLRKVW
jgi:tetratricopeptide (TPR) repeat protein